MTEDDGRLRRSRSNKMIAGVIGGLARYFNFDPTMARVIYVVLWWSRWRSPVYSSTSSSGSSCQRVSDVTSADRLS